MRPAIVAAVWTWAASMAWCQDPVPATGRSAGWYLLQALVSLVLVVALIVGAHLLARRWTGVRPGQSGPARLLQTLPLGGGNALHIVRIGNRVMAIGAGPGGVRPLGDLDEADLDEPVGERTP